MTIYERNIEALHQFHPELVELLEQDIPMDHIQVQQAESGASRLLVRLESGEVAAVHNAIDPIGVAEETAKKMEVEPIGVLVVMGMGLGYLAKRLVQGLQERSALVIYEADPGIFKIALQEVELTDLFSSPRAKVVVGKEARLEPACYHFMVETGGRVRVARYEPAFRLDPSFYETKWDKELMEFVKATAMNFATIGKFGPIFTRCVLEAIPHILLAGGVNQLEGLFPQSPAILVAAGPSLEKNVGLLKEVKGRAVIICADTILGYLLKRDIVPDFVVSVDPQDMTYSKYQGVDVPKEIALVFHSCCNDKIFKHFPGRIFVTASRMSAYQWLEHLFPSKGSLEDDVHCQMHLAFNLAQCLSCDPIVFIGQDLCYTDSLMHVTGASYMPKSDEDAYVARGVPTRNIFGDPVKSYMVFLMYKAGLERKIKAFSGTVLNATEGGLPLEGAANVLLSDVIHDYCQEKQVEVAGRLQAVDRASHVPDWDVLVQEVQDRVRDLFRIGRVASRLLSLIEEITQEQKKGDSCSERLVHLTQKAEKLTSRIPRYAKALGLLQMVDFDLELYMRRGTVETIDDIEDSEEKLGKQIERANRYYRALLRVVPPLRNSLVRLHSRLEELRDLQLSTDSAQPVVGFLDQAERYAKIEIFTLASECLSRHGESEENVFPDPTKALLNVRLSLELNQLTRAVESAQKVQELFPDHSEVQTMCAQVNTRWQEWQEQLKDGVSPNSKGESTPLAPGDFYFRVGNYEKAVEHYRQVTQRDNTCQGEAWYRMAKAYEAQGKTQETVDALEQALVASPADPRVYYDLGTFSLEHQRFDVAERFFIKGAEVSLEDPVYCEAAAAVLCAAGVPLQAIPFYERALAQCPGDPDLVRKISEAYQSVFTPVPSA